jgi:hypothetical protein
MSQSSRFKKELERRGRLPIDDSNFFLIDAIRREHIVVDRYKRSDTDFFCQTEGLPNRHVADDTCSIAIVVTLVHRQKCDVYGAIGLKYLDYVRVYRAIAAVIKTATLKLHDVTNTAEIALFISLYPAVGCRNGT